MQKPHCGTPWRDERVLHRVQRAALASPSIVRTSRPRACIASTRQLATGLPSRCTVHAPQSPVPQPSLGPVRPSTSRTASSSVSYGWTSTSAGSPLIVQFSSMLGHGQWSPLSAAARSRARARWSACGESARARGGGETRPSRADRRSDCAACDRELGGSLDRLRASPASPSSACSAAVARSGTGATAARAMRALAHTPFAHGQLRGHADDGDVELAAGRVAHVGAAAAAPVGRV